MIRLDKAVTYMNTHKSKIKLRRFSNLLGSTTLFLIPLLIYTSGKMSGAQYNEMEWLWALVISCLFILWVVINFKIVKNERN